MLTKAADDPSPDYCLAIIPSRGGSKGLPRKNILPLLGKPLIAYSIEAARASRFIGRVVVSTDDVEIAEIARRYDAEVPFLRPPDLARDDTPSLPVVQHVISQLQKSDGYEPKVIILLQPTSPLRRTADIDRSVALLTKSGADSVVSVCIAEHHPYWMKSLEGDQVRPFLANAPEHNRRQDLPPVYRLNGAVYVTRREVVTQHNLLLGSDTRGVVMDADSSVDIDTLLDFKLAEFILRQRTNVHD